MKQEELLHHIQNYAITGIIDDGLVPYYDQFGQWRGDSINWTAPLPSAHKQISKSVLPESRRTTLSRSGTVLLTSFYWRGDSPATIIHCEIKGSLVVTDNASVHAANLRRVGGHLVIHSNHRIYLPLLQFVGGNFEAMKGFLLRAPRLREVGGDMMVVGHVPPRLETVGGRLGAYWLFEFESPRLRHVGGALVAPKSEVVLTPLLETIGGGLLQGNRAHRLHAPSLRTVGGDFLAASVTDMRVPRLRIIGGDMDTRGAQGYYHPAVRVEGEWTTCPGAVEDWTKRLAARLAIRGHSDPICL